MREIIVDDIEPEEVEIDIPAQRNWEREAAKVNREVELARARNYEESMGIKSVIYKDLPLYVQKEDLMRQSDISIPNYPIVVTTHDNTYGAKNIYELIQLLKVNVGKSELEQILNGEWNGWKFTISNEYRPKLINYIKRFN